MMAETMGILSEREGLSPFLNFTKGVLKLTFSGTHSVDEYPGMIRYSPNV
jgi:hypothetical protein